MFAPFSIVDRNSFRVTCLAVALVLVAGLVYSVHLGSVLRFADEREYWTLATNLMRLGVYSVDGSHPTAYRPPGYPFWLAVIRWLGGGIPAARIANYLLLAATMLLLHDLLRRADSARAGSIAALLVICYPVLFYTASTLYPQTLAGFLLVAFVHLVFVNLTLPRAALAGAVMGWLVLTVPVTLFVLVATLPVLWRRSRGVWLLLTMVLTSALCISGWTVRNYFTFKAFVPISTNSGINLLLGNSPKTTAGAGVNVDISDYLERARGLNEVQRNVFYQREALRFISENKVEAFILYLQKVLHHFHYRNQLATRGESPPLYDLLMFVTYYPLLALAFLRFALRKKYPTSSLERYLLAIYLLDALVQAVFFTRIRFRLPFDLLLIALVALFLSNLSARHVTGQRGTR